MVLGNDSRVLGKYIAFHNYSAHIGAEVRWLERMDRRRATFADRRLPYPPLQECV